MRIQPDMLKGMLKVTVGCHEKTDTTWLTLMQLEEATEIEPGYAFT
jgi:hypothetical protein